MPRRDCGSGSKDRGSFGGCGSAVGGGWQSCEANSGMPLVADVQADEQRGNLLDDARVFQLAAINGANARNLGGKFARELRRVGIVAADNHIAIEWRVSVE